MDSNINVTNTTSPISVEAGVGIYGNKVANLATVKL
jgi:hypothetical protein